MEKNNEDNFFGDEKALPLYQVVKEEIAKSFYEANNLLQQMKFQNRAIAKNTFYMFCSQVTHLFMLVRNDIIEYIEKKEKKADREDYNKFSYLLNLDDDVDTPNFKMKDLYKVGEEDYLIWIRYFKLLSRFIYDLGITKIKIKTIAPDFSVMEGLFS